MPVFRLSRSLAFPPPHLADDGLLAVGGGLGIDRLLLAYRSGIFPWYSEDEPVLWWSPDPRTILPMGGMRVSRSLRKVLRQGRFEFTLDRAFENVIRQCSSVPRKGQDGTWITPSMIRAYSRLHRAGYAHSIECWRDNRLMGGLYGVSLGACFFGESMFSAVPDASKACMAVLMAQLALWGFHFLDCQVPNPHLVSLGAVDIPRAEFLAMLERGMTQETRKGTWSLTIDPARV